jgi:putative transcriptional regulator
VADSALNPEKEMSKAGARILQGARGLSQTAFTTRYGFSTGRVRDWEQGRSNISAPSRILSTVIDKEPDAVERSRSSP